MCSDACHRGDRQRAVPPAHRRLLDAAGNATAGVDQAHWAERIKTSSLRVMASARPGNRPTTMSDSNRAKRGKPWLRQDALSNPASRPRGTPRVLVVPLVRSARRPPHLTLVAGQYSSRSDGGDDADAAADGDGDGDDETARFSSRLPAHSPNGRRLLVAQKRDSESA